MGLVVVTPPATEPVTLTEAKAHVRVEATDDDTLITALVIAARQFCEEYTKRAFVTQTLRYSADDLPDQRWTAGRTREFGDWAYWAFPYAADDILPRWWVVELPRPPLVSVTSVNYTDVNGVAQVFTGYTADTDAMPGRLILNWPGGWPTGASITYVAGYGNAAAVPQAIKQAILLLIGHWYENREASVIGATGMPLPMAVDALLGPYRVMSYG